MMTWHDGTRNVIHVAAPHDVSSNSAPDIVVLYTTVASTLAALEKAVTLARGLGGGIRLVFPRLVPYPLPIDRPPVCEEFVRAGLQDLVAGRGFQIVIELVACRDVASGLRSALRSDSVVVIGIRRGWWRTREARLARGLEKCGYQVVVLECA